MSNSASALIRAAPTVSARPWARHVMPPAAWREMADRLAEEPSLALLGLWADTEQVHALFLDETANETALAPLAASTPVEAGFYAALSPHRPGASLFERMIADLWGHRGADARDPRPWLDHGRWTQQPPMAARPLPALAGADPAPPEFLPAEGDDLHQVPVGPIHAGIIEPGHFRFTAAGETVVRLEARLGYTHKGTMRLMQGKTPTDAARLAARISGDTTVAHAIAFARAAEAACGVAASPRARQLRQVMLELERIANHLGDVGAVCGDAAFAPAPALFHLQREAMLRAAAHAFGHRLMMDKVLPGGVAVDLSADGAAALLDALAALETVLPELHRLLDMPGLSDRLHGAGVTAPALAARLAPGGFVGRAAGRRYDARLHDAPDFQPVVRAEGDVDARLRVRLAEIAQSINLACAMLADMPPSSGDLLTPLPAAASGEGFGLAEGFRGEIFHWLRLEAGLITAIFPRDPSWLHWPLLEAAIEGNIIGDFPLINKSFNSSYSGVDL